MRILPLVAAALLPLAAAHAQTAHDASATSTAHVETVKTEEGETAVVMKVRNARFVPYYIYAADNKYPTRLVTIVTEVLTRSDREGADPSSSVSVTVDDFSGAETKRLAAFSDPGTEGEVIARRYFASTMPGCCDSPDIHRVRALETGRELFHSTGPGDFGSAAWAEVPNSRPGIVRWAAFDGEVDETQFKAGVLGTITYGSDLGPASRIRISTSVGEDEHNDLWEGLAHSATLRWIDPKHPADDVGETAGDPEAPTALWSLEGVTDPKLIQGFELQVLIDGKAIATIPVTEDRLVVKGATLEKNFSLTAVQP